MEPIWDCIVVGGGAAGLSAALVLGRARRRTLVVDGGRPSNAPAHGIGGLLGHDGRPPAELYAAGRAELAAYPTVEIIEGEVVVGSSGARAGSCSTWPTARSTSPAGSCWRPAWTTATRTSRASTERWGTSVFHCPFCHGWEVRDGRLGVLDRGPDAVHRALLLRAWSDDVTVLTDGPGGLTDDEAVALARAGVTVDERSVAGMEGPDATLTHVRFTDGTSRPLDGLLVPVVLHQRSTLAAQLGATTSTTPLAADAIDVDVWMQTSVPGLVAAGDVSVMPSVANAIAAGSMAASSVVRSLVMDAA